VSAKDYFQLLVPPPFGVGSDLLENRAVNAKLSLSWRMFEFNSEVPLELWFFLVFSKRPDPFLPVKIYSIIQSIAEAPSKNALY
jgi:hypothetical protein